MKARKAFSKDTWIALAATVTAVSALAVTLWQGIETRKHNRLSVQPHLTFTVSGFTHPSNKKIGIRISNNGSGPAIIKRFTVFVDDEVAEKDKWGGWIDALTKLDIYEPWIYMYAPDLDDAIAPGQTLVLLGLSDFGKTEVTDGQFYRFSAALDRVDVAVEYESIYGEPHRQKSSAEPPPYAR